MFETPVDAVYVWVGLALTSVAALGVAVQLPTERPPDAAGVADTVDTVATSEYPATGAYRSRAETVRLGTRRVWLRNDGGRTAATFVSGVVPTRSERLQQVLHGANPRRVYDSRREFTTAVHDARQADAKWRETDGRVVVRRLTWGDLDVTLVGD
jgi:hypothetical protein